MNNTTDVKLIDLGLPSGTLWADRNIGASSPEDSGLFFQWGDTQGYTAEQCGSVEDGKKPFAGDWSDYKFYENGAFTKYQGTGDGTILELDTEDDAATVNMGAKFSIPNKDQMDELFKGTTQKLILSDGTEIPATSDSDFTTNGYIDWKSFELGDRTIKGIKFIGSNGNDLFFPTSGFLFDDEAQDAGVGGGVWSSSRYEDFESIACYLLFDSDYAGVTVYFRCYGLPVRAVANKTV